MGNVTVGEGFIRREDCGSKYSSFGDITPSLTEAWKDAIEKVVGLSAEEISEKDFLDWHMTMNYYSGDLQDDGKTKEEADRETIKLVKAGLLDLNGLRA